MCMHVRFLTYGTVTVQLYTMVIIRDNNGMAAYNNPTLGKLNECFFCKATGGIFSRHDVNI